MHVPKKDGREEEYMCLKRMGLRRSTRTGLRRTSLRRSTCIPDEDGLNEQYVHA